MPIFGIILESCAGLFEEISVSLGKREAARGRGSIFMMGFVQHFAALIFLGLVVLLGFDQWKLSMESLPWIALRIPLELVQLYFTLIALELADRTEFSFFKVGTVPFLLLVDLALGYVINVDQIIGMLLLMGLFAFIFFKKIVSRKGLPFVIFSTINPVLTISIFKHNITHFNSVATEQFIIYLVLVIFLMLLLIFKTKENPFKFMFRRIEIGEAMSVGLCTLLSSYAYIFAPASVILTARRAGGVLWSTLSGIFFFKEDHKKQKAFTAFTLVIILILLAR
ncbi:hypothetical protein IT411_04025 [Candidatus Peregrinibacteria bacterium]|nr:hypothetical protein [Candidatus Peregrinibacteria bacterium]